METGADTDRPRDRARRLRQNERGRGAGETKNDHLFITKTGNPLLVRNIRATIDRYFKLAGIEHATVNDLRHTFVVTHLLQGASLTMISKIAGHKRISTTEKYLNYIQRDNKEEKSELLEL